MSIRYIFLVAQINKKYSQADYIVLRIIKNSQLPRHITQELQYWPIYYGFFQRKKVKILNISNTELHIEKKIQWLLEKTNKEENAKTKAFHFENYARIQGLKKTLNSLFSMNKKILCIFRKKTASRKICLYSIVTPLISCC